MNLEELIRGAFESIPTLREVEEAAVAEGVSTEELLIRFSRVVAERYLAGVYPYGPADKAMNNIFAVAHRDGNGFPDFAWDVYLAFDEGEFVRPGLPEDQQGEPLTRKLLQAAL